MLSLPSSCSGVHPGAGPPTGSYSCRRPEADRSPDARVFASSERGQDRAESEDDRRGRRDSTHLLSSQRQLILLLGCYYTCPRGRGPEEYRRDPPASTIDTTQIASATPASATKTSAHGTETTDRQPPHGLDHRVLPARITEPQHPFRWPIGYGRRHRRTASVLEPWPLLQSREARTWRVRLVVFQDAELSDHGDLVHSIRAVCNSVALVDD